MQAVGHAAAQQRQLDEGVVAAGLALAQQKVVGVAGPGLRVGAVGALELDRLDVDVVKVELADVGDRAALDGVVGESGGAVVDDGFFGGRTCFSFISYLCFDRIALEIDNHPGRM